MKKIILTALVASTLASTVAFANTTTMTTTTSSMQMTNPNSISVIGNLGFGFTGGDMSKGASTKSGVVGGIAIAYNYTLNEQVSIGAELGFQYANKFTKMNMQKNVNGIDFNGHGSSDMISVPILATIHYKIPSVTGMNVFGKIGMAFNSIKYKLDVTGTKQGQSLNMSQSNTSTEMGVEAAIGAGYEMQQGLNIFGQYTFNTLKYKDNETNLNGSMNTIAVGVSYKLPIF